MESYLNLTVTIKDNEKLTDFAKLFEHMQSYELDECRIVLSKLYER